MQPHRVCILSSAMTGVLRALRASPVLRALLDRCASPSSLVILPFLAMAVYAPASAAAAAGTSAYASQHPCLLFTPAELPALRDKLSDGGRDDEAYAYLLHLAQDYYPLMTPSEILGAEFPVPFRVLRQVLFWFDVPRGIERFAPERCPVYIWELQTGTQVIYGFPAVDGARGGVKIATEQYEAETAPDAVARAVSDDEIRAMHARYVAPHLPDLSPVCVRAATCLYTVTPDAGFVIDRHPESDAVIVVSVCSGHGFKHSAAIGEALAELCLEGLSRADLSAFRLERFAH